MDVQRLDHLVLTVRDIGATCDFYRKALGVESIEFGEGRKALKFGEQKINLHREGEEIDPHAGRPIPGSADLCFLTPIPLEAVLDHLRRAAILIESGPVDRDGAEGPIRSVYLRDPDGNLIEISNRITG